MVSQPEELALERRVLQILAELLETPPPDRTRLLIERSGGDGELRARLEKLVELEAEGELTRDGDLPAVVDFEPPEEESNDIEPGGRIGAYQILRPIARGGMGQVFEALQDEPRRRVALKVLRLGLDSDSARRRFRLESEVLARLRHPAIAQIYEAGTHQEPSALGEREIPFFALEFVEDARTLVDYAREHGLSRGERIDLFLEVCDAVHHGHESGVLHRDLKPQNILVDPEGRPKVIDFGVARVLDREVGTTARETLPGQIVGTVQYMSPEQLDSDEGELDGRCDVYALGVILFELLCERLPFPIGQQPIAAVVLTILETPPPRPRKLRPDMDPDLEAVVLRALAKERDERYASVRDLADDLRRHRRHEPVLAKAPGLLHRARLFARRNRVALTGVGAVLLVTAGGGATTAFFARRSQAALGKASTFEEALIEFNDEMTLDLLTEMAAKGVPIESRAAILRAATERLEALATDRHQSGVTLSLAAAYRRFAGLLGTRSQPNVGLPEQAQAAYLRSEELLEGLLEDEPDNLEGHHQLAIAWIGMADLARAEGEAEQAAELTDRARERLEWILERDDVPSATDTRDALALIHYRSIRNLHGDTDAMLAALDRAEELWAEAAEEDPGSVRVRHGRALGASTRGSILLALGRHEEAAEVLELGYGLHEGLHLEAPDHVATAANFVGVARDLSSALLQCGELDGAVEVAESALAPAEILLGVAESGMVGQGAVAIHVQLARALIARVGAGGRGLEADVERTLDELDAAEAALDSIPGQPSWAAHAAGDVEELRVALDEQIARGSGGD